jgi:hypothetical protein
MRKTRDEFHTPELNPRHHSRHKRRTRVEFHTPHLDPRHQDFGVIPPVTPVEKISSKIDFLWLAVGSAAGALLGLFMSRFL